jgi:voltage-gated potassium channel
MRSEERPNSGWRGRLHEVIFEADTPAGKAFDLAVIGAILLSVAVVMLESVSSIRARYGHELYILEWVFTILFSVEYLLRVIAVRSPLRYMGSFFGVVDLLAVLPTYISLIVPGSHYLLTIRILRLLRIFRILKLTHYLTEAGVITSALRASRRKILVFLLGVLTLATIVGTLIYVVEGEKHGFTDIPTSIYWAIVTLTTVGYGDLSPQTPAGKFLASIVMIMGYGIIAVPTGIVTVELGKAAIKPVSTQACPACGVDGHEHDATFCRVCGERL